MFFFYKAIDKDNKEVSGKVEASNRTNAITLLLNKNYNVLSLKEENKSKLDVNLFLRVKTKDIVIFSRQIATLFEAEVSALRAFNLISENVQNKYFQGILRDISKNIEQGFSIERSFQKYENIFGEFFISVIAVGEKSGTLPKSFSYLADYVERNADIVSRIKKALTYPIFVIVMFFAVMTLMLVSVIPQISTILLQSGQDLPFITDVVISASMFFNENLSLILFAILSLIIFVIFWARTEQGKKTLDELAITMPLIGKLFRTFYIVRFSNNLSVMLSSGVPIVSSLSILSRVMGNDIYKEMVEEIGKSMRQGSTLSAALESQPLIGKNISQIIKVGEETGKLSKMLDVTSNFYQKQLQDTIDTLLDLIQPTIIVFLGLGVGTLIGAVIIPIYSISTSI